jgi:hypothetical protein
VQQQWRDPPQYAPAQHPAVEEEKNPVPKVPAWRVVWLLPWHVAVATADFLYLQRASLAIATLGLPWPGEYQFLTHLAHIVHLIFFGMHMHFHRGSDVLRAAGC